MLLRWGVNVLIGFDQLGNTFAGGDPDETISSRLGKLARRHGGKIPWWRPLSWLIGAGLEAIDPGHLRDAIEEDEGIHAVVDFDQIPRRRNS
jgi:hypothetical protein